MTRLNGDAWEGTSRPNDEGWVSAAQDGGSTAAGYDIAALGDEPGRGDVDRSFRLSLTMFSSACL